MEIRDLRDREWDNKEKIILAIAALFILFLILRFTGDAAETVEQAAVSEISEQQAFQENSTQQNDAELALLSETELAKDEEMLQESNEEENSLNSSSTSTDSDDSSWSLGESEQINGTPLLFLPLESGDSGPAKNILFMNTQTNDSYWMFDEDERLILDVNQFPESFGSSAGGNETQAIFYDVVVQDNNQDGEINIKDSAALAVSTAEGRNYRVILDEYDSIISKNITEENNVFMVYRNAGVNYSMLFQLNPFRVLSQKELPQVGSRSVASGCPANISNSDEAIECAIFHGGKVANLAGAKSDLSTERSGPYWIIRQDTVDSSESHWEFVLTANGNLMSMKEIDNDGLNGILQ